MSVPAPFAPQPDPLRNSVGIVTFVLGLVVVFGLVVYTAGLAVAGLAAVGRAVQHVGGAVAGSAEHDSTGRSVATQDLPKHGLPEHGLPKHGATTQAATAAPVAALPVAATPNGATMAFDQLWTAGDGNTIVAGAPTVGTSAQTGESVIRVAVTLTNNGERDWSPVSTSFIGKLNRAPVPESTEGDWMYSTPIAPHTSVTLTKVFVAGPGQFSVSMSTPHGVALFTDQA